MMKRLITSIPLLAVLAAGMAAQTNAPAPPATPPAPQAVPAPPAPPDTDQEAQPAQPAKPARPARPLRQRNTERIIVTRGGGGSYLGIVAHDVTQERMSALKLREERGVEVATVDADGPAGKAGLKPQDVILTYNGTNVESYDQLARMIRETPVGRTVKLGISRDGQPMTLSATIGKRTDEFAALRDLHVTVPPIDMNNFDFPNFTMVTISMRSGAAVEDLTPQLSEYFGVKGGGGVLVRSVEHGSDAAVAGMKAGDVIIKVNNQPVKTGNDWRRLLNSGAGGTVTVTVLRDHREQNLSVKVPERKRGAVMFDQEALRAQMRDLPKFEKEMKAFAESQRKMADELRRKLVVVEEDEE